MKRIAIAATMSLALTAFGSFDSGLPALAQDKPDSRSGLVVHEWGTFTAVLGADGAMLEWQPLIGEDLPSFVYNRATTVQRGGKGDKSMPSYERMETPVLYFYSDREMSVNVDVRFPKGLITEWYPFIRHLEPELKDGTAPINVAGGRVYWSNVRIVPNPATAPVLPTKGESRHYYQARETDSAYVCVTDGRRTEWEKYLFYRGLGNFDLPLTVKTAEGARFSVTNPTERPIRHLFALRIERDGSGRFSYVDRVGAGATCSIAADGKSLSKSDFIASIGAKLEEALVAEGLYRKEAKAMVKTWEESYFQTEGTRLLYVLPEALTNEILPIAISPAPRELKRVLVARVDAMTPEQTRSLHEMIRELGADGFDAREAASKRIASFGRFAQPALAEALRTATDAEVKSRLKDLLDKLTPRR